MITSPKKPAQFVQHKISLPIIEPKDPRSLSEWAALYMMVQVMGGSKNTALAKQGDLEKFLSFFQSNVGTDQVAIWTPSITKAFQTQLLTNYKATSINRIMATLGHFAKWLHERNPLPVGDPFQGVSTIRTDQPNWNGLSERQIMLMKSACDIRLKVCTRKNQNPQLEAAVFYVLLHTGLRESELVALNLGQYHHKGFHQVKRKGNMVTRKVSVPGQAREYLDAYLEKRLADGNELLPEAPLFVGRYGQRITRYDVYQIVKRINNQACSQLTAEDRFQVSPHSLRHTFLKRIADKEGIHIAQEMSGNVSIKEIFRYTKPSSEEIEIITEDLY